MKNWPKSAAGDIFLYIEVWWWWRQKIKPKNIQKCQKGAAGAIFLLYIRRTGVSQNQKKHPSNKNWQKSAAAEIIWEYIWMVRPSGGIKRVFFGKALRKLEKAPQAPFFWYICGAGGGKKQKIQFSQKKNSKKALQVPFF